MSIDFSRKLIKGRITEAIFEQMIREEDRYDVIPFGYKHTMPTLAQYQNLVEISRVIKNISDAPDFALISKDKKEVYLVEVKYRNSLNHDDLKKYAADLLERWNPSWIFIATPKGFYCASCRSIVEDNSINKLSENWVVADRQKEYLDLLNEFI